MIGRHLGKQPAQDRRETALHRAQQAAFLRDAHQPEEERHHADQADHQVDGVLRAGERRRLHGVHATR